MSFKVVEQKELLPIAEHILCPGGFGAAEQEWVLSKRIEHQVLRPVERPSAEHSKTVPCAEQTGLALVAEQYFRLELRERVEHFGIGRAKSTEVGRAPRNGCAAGASHGAIPAAPTAR